MEIVVRRVLVGFQPGAGGKEGSGPQTGQDDRSPTEHALHRMIRSRERELLREIGTSHILTGRPVPDSLDQHPVSHRRAIQVDAGL